MKNHNSSFLKLAILFCIFYISLFFYFVNGMNRLNFFYDFLFTLPLIFIISRIKSNILKNILFLSIIFIFFFYTNFYKITGSFINKEYILHYLKEWKNIYSIILHNTKTNFILIFLFITISSYFIIKTKNKHTNTVLIFILLTLTIITPHQTTPSVLKNILLSDNKHSIPMQTSYPYTEIQLSELKEKNNDNVLIIVIESMRYSTFHENIDKLKNIKSILNKSTYFEKSYTTTSHTSKALVGIICGIHPDPNLEILEIQHLAKDCLPNIYQKNNFETYFFQSATKKFEHREKLVQKMGFKNFISKEDLNQNFENSGYFGIDEMALIEPINQVFAKENPFFITILTSMTHHPYQEVGKIAPSKIEQLKEGYINNLIHTDKMIGELISTLKKLGKYDNTTIIITGDHGEGFGEHLGLYQHDFIPFETVTHIPLIVKRQGETHAFSKKLTQHIDIYPTLLDTNFTLRKEYKRPGINLFSEVEHPYVVTSCWSAICGSIIDKDGNKYYKFNKEQYGITNINIDPNEQNIQILLNKELENIFSTYEYQDKELYNNFK